MRNHGSLLRHRFCKLMLLCLTASHVLQQWQQQQLSVSTNVAWTAAFFHFNDAHHVSPRPPSKPLRPECLEIVRQALWTDLSFVNVAGDYSEHPHRGAVGPDFDNTAAAADAIRYIHDTRALARNPPPLTISKEDIQAFCKEHDAEYKMLTERVVIDFEYEQRQQAAASSFNNRQRAQLLCIIYTTKANHHRIQNIRETWGPKCDGFLAASNVTDPAMNTVHILHEGPEEYANLWQKVRSIWSYVYDNYYADYDWFHIGGDDLFLLVENLRAYLESDEIQAAQNGGFFLLPQYSPQSAQQVPLYLGKRMNVNGNDLDSYASGGSGYTLNKAALKRLVMDGLPNYYHDTVAAAEDVFVGRVLKQTAFIYPYETKDEHGGERYMHYYPSFHYPYKIGARPWHDQYSVAPLVEGYNHSSPQSIAFHYIRDQQMKRLHYLLYDNKCPNVSG